MEQILTLKVDLEHPDDAHYAIDKAFDADKTKHEQMKMAAGMEASVKGEIR
jgi:hypothetical protein